jgi:hypothetical protein
MHLVLTFLVFACPALGAAVTGESVDREWIASRVRQEITRNRPVLNADQLHEYEQALACNEALLRDAR